MIYTSAQVKSPYKANQREAIRGFIKKINIRSKNQTEKPEKKQERKKDSLLSKTGNRNLGTGTHEQPSAQALCGAWRAYKRTGDNLPIVALKGPYKGGGALAPPCLILALPRTGWRSPPLPGIPVSGPSDHRLSPRVGKQKSPRAQRLQGLYFRFYAALSPPMINYTADWLKCRRQAISASQAVNLKSLCICLPAIRASTADTVSTGIQCAPVIDPDRQPRSGHQARRQFLHLPHSQRLTP